MILLSVIISIHIEINHQTRFLFLYLLHSRVYIPEKPLVILINHYLYNHHSIGMVNARTMWSLMVATMSHAASNILRCFRMHGHVSECMV